MCSLLAVSALHDNALSEMNKEKNGDYNKAFETDGDLNSTTVNGNGGHAEVDGPAEESKKDGEEGDVAVEREEYRMHYNVGDNPPIHMTCLFGLQQVLLSISSTISIPLIVAREICADDLDLVKSEIMSTFLFMSGVCTLLQTTIGVRLPILQGGCHKFIPAVAALMALPMWRCPDVAHITTFVNDSMGNITELQVSPYTDDERTEIWQSRMREIQGGIIVASMVQIFIGCTGILGLILHYIGPITICPTITLVGLSLIDVAMRFCEKHWGIAALTVVLVLLFSMYLSEFRVPLPTYSKLKKCHITWYPLFKLLPVILAVLISWAVCGILTETDSLSSDPSSKEYATRTDARTQVVSSANWFFFPYPGQWGLPTVSFASYMAMLAATITSIIESVGDYYACARISCAPPPPPHAVNRGIAMEGFGSLLSGVVGSGGATTSYSQNVGAIGFTKVASRRAFQAAGVILALCGLCGKFGAVLTMLPDPVLGGIVLVSFGMVTSVGLSNLQFVSLRSGRNLMIIGVSILVGLMAPKYITSNPGCINTGSDELDRVLTVLFSTAMFVGGFLGFILDNTVPGTDEERGIKLWRKALVKADASSGYDKTYDLPFIMGCLRRQRWATYVPFLPTFKARNPCRGCRTRCHAQEEGNKV